MPSKGASRSFVIEKARLVAIFDGHDLLGHRSGLAMVDGRLD